MTLKSGYFLIKLLEEKEESADLGGFKLPASEETDIVKGIITEYSRPSDTENIFLYKEEQTVLFNKSEARKINIDGSDLFLVEEKSIYIKL